MIISENLKFLLRNMSVMTDIIFVITSGGENIAVEDNISVIK